MAKIAKFFGKYYKIRQALGVRPQKPLGRRLCPLPDRNTLVTPYHFC